MKMLLVSLLTVVSAHAFAGEGNGEPFPARNPGMNVPASCGREGSHELAPHCPSSGIVLRPSTGNPCPFGQELVYDRGLKRATCLISPTQGSGG